MRAQGKKGNGEGSIFQLKDGSWRGFITIGFNSKGKQVKKWRRGRTRREVSDKLNKIAAEAGSRLVTQPENITLEQWLARYAALRAVEVKPSTRSNHTHYLSKIVPELGHLYLKKLQPFHVSELYAKLAEAGYSASVRKHLHHFLKGAMQDAFRQKLVERNPLEAIPTPKGGDAREPEVWNAEEIEAFLKTADSNRLYPLFYTLIALGPRIGEMLALRWSDMSGDKMQVQRTLSMVRGKLLIGPPKTKRSYRAVYLSSDVLAVLQRRREEQELERSTAKHWCDNDLVFSTSVGTYLGPNNVRRAFYRLITETGVPKIRIHDLRHTYITLARDAGIDAEVVADRVGQDVSVTMKIYSQITEARKRKAAYKLEDLLNENHRHLHGTYRSSDETHTSQLNLN